MRLRSLRPCMISIQLSAFTMSMWTASCSWTPVACVAYLLLLYSICSVQHVSRWTCSYSYAAHLQVREFLEKGYKEVSGKETIKAAIRALTEAVEAGSKNMEVAVVERETGMRILADADVDSLVEEINADKAAADAARRSSATGTGT